LIFQIFMNAMRRPQMFLALSVAFMAGGGCQLPQTPLAAAAPKREQVRVNCYSLLHDLLDKQKNVDKLLLVKLESAELHHLIKTIASASDMGAKRLKEFATRDASINLDQLSLPPGEVATRDAIASTKTKELLTPFNANFESYLLLTQAEALSYAWHLSKVAAANESQPERAHYLTRLSEEMKDLHHRATSLMRARLATSRHKDNS
jgi:hypothetical protein